MQNKMSIYLFIYFIYLNKSGEYRVTTEITQTYGNFNLKNVCAAVCRGDPKNLVKGGGGLNILKSSSKLKKLLKNKAIEEIGENPCDASVF